MNFFGIEENAGVLIPDEGVVIPAIPEAFQHLNEFGSPKISLVVIIMFFTAEILRSGWVAACNDIEARAP